MLPNEELTRLATARGARVAAVRLCTMVGCGEELQGPPSTGFVGVTWGVILELTAGELAITWSDDAAGDPFRIGLVEPATLRTIDSLVEQDVSALSPWCDYVGSTLDAYEVLVYESNYSLHPSSRTWHSVPWGLLMHIGPRRLLAAAAYCEDPLQGSPCADELVLSFSDLTIRRIAEARMGERSEWRRY